MTRNPPPKPGIENCPTCDGGGRVVDLRYGRERRLTCRTCEGSGRIDAGVWPYYPPRLAEDVTRG